MATVPSDSSGNGRSSDVRTYQDDSVGLGELLRRARERRGLTLEQVADEMKLPRWRLEAIERDNLSALPKGFYGRAQIRAYARALHLDPDLVLARFDRAFEPPARRQAPSESPRAQPPALSRKRMLIVGTIIVIVVAVVLGRAMGGGEPAGDDEARALSARDSSWYGVPAAFERSADDPQTLSQSAQPDRAAQPSVPSDGPLTIPIEAAIRSSRHDATAVHERQPADLAQAPGPAQPDRVELPPPPSDTALAVPSQPPPVARTTTATADAEAALGLADLPPPASSVTELVVTTQPAGARVTVNGVGWGVAPVTIRYLPAGAGRVRVSKDGYATEERVVSLAEGRRRIVDIQLRSTP